MVLGVRQVYSSDLPKTWEIIKHTDHVLQLWRWTNYMYMKIMMINKNLKRPMLHKLLTERGQICALVSREGPSMGFRCGFFCVLFNRRRTAGIPSSSFNNSFFITLQQFFYCQHPVWKQKQYSPIWSISCP